MRLRRALRSVMIAVLVALAAGLCLLPRAR